MKKLPFFLFLILLSPFAIGQDTKDSTKVLNALRVTVSPKIDGLLDDEVWKNAESVSDFIQKEPLEGSPAGQKTEVKVVYDDYAVYVGAMLYDTAPDSILSELGNRDDDGLNAEYFRFVIDPYHNLQDNYAFQVYSSGVQLDNRYSDYTYNAVWESAVKIVSNGWSVEIKIPYSAIRFPDKKEQLWGLQFGRQIRRTREYDQWCLTPASQPNPMKYFGILKGINDIHPPLRLSLTPYFSTYYETAPEYYIDGTYDYAKSFSYNAGADIKYGLDERFTIDMTLLPDFGQVQSDNKVKNLSYREVNYEDNRPFFKEGTELFNKEGLFYSRRVGKTPSLFYSVPYLLSAGETIEKNPSQTKLINATKLTGRTNNGLGIGLFNAITDNTYAIVRDSLGTDRKILTEPLTNYNAIVFDQQLKNSSSVYLINTNVIRNGSGYRSANVTGTGFNFQNKKNTYEFYGATNLTQIYTRIDSLENAFNTKLGYFYKYGIGKISGNWQFGAGNEVMNDSYDRSDMGYYATINYSAVYAYVNYRTFKPWKSLLRTSSSVNFNYGNNYTTKLRTGFSLNLNLFALFKNYVAVFGGANLEPKSNYDYYEPRVAGRYCFTSQYHGMYAGFSTNYSKKFALDANFNTGAYPKNNINNYPTARYYGFSIGPRFRASDKLSFQHFFNYSYDPFNPGFANFDTSGAIIFGGRQVHSYENTLTARYIFKNNLSFSLNARHYWLRWEYKKYYTLMDDGTLAENTTYTQNNDFSYNAFNIDAVFSWEFAPGSLISVVYKNAIETDEQIILPKFSNNFSNTIESPQTNSISLKVLYYLDYQYLKKK